MENEYEFEQNENLDQDIFVEDQEFNENDIQQIINDDSGTIDSNTVVNDDPLVEDMVNDSLEELLKEYIKTQIEDQEENLEENNVIESIDSKEEIVEENSIDYTEILQSISDKSDLINTTQEQIYQRSVSFDENNCLTADINDISLTNALLLMLFICSLFSGVINFARRLF